jgi:TatA/E family protein of Tat protein translocase
VFGIGGGELLFIAFVALLIFGPAKIPELARTAARGYRELVKLRRQMDSTLDDVKRDLNLDAELRDLGLPEPLSLAPPPMKQPTERRISAGQPTPPRPAPAGVTASSDTAERFLFEPLPVPEEDDYLSPRPAPARASADSEDDDYLRGAP